MNLLQKTSVTFFAALVGGAVVYKIVTVLWGLM